MFLSDGSSTSLLRVYSPRRAKVDRELAPGHVIGCQGGRVRGEQTQPGGSAPDLTHRPVCELIHSQEIRLDTSSEESVVSLKEKY